MDRVPPLLRGGAGGFKAPGSSTSSELRKQAFAASAMKSSSNFGLEALVEEAAAAAGRSLEGQQQQQGGASSSGEAPTGRAWDAYFDERREVDVPTRCL